MTKRNMFIVILLMMAGTSAIFSLLTRVTVLDLNYSNPVRIAVVGPLEGADAETGAALLRGAQLAAEQANGSGGIRGRAVVVERFDDSNTADGAIAAAKTISETEGITAVIGHWSPEATAAAAPIYEAAGIPLLTTAPASARAEGAVPEWQFRTVYDDLEQTRFLANYLRNVIGQETVSIIHANTERGRALADAFDKTYRRFGTKVLNFWAYDPSDLDGLTRRAEAIAQEMRDKKLTGHVFVQGGAPQAARIVTALRQGRVRNGIVGLSDMATGAFVSEVQAVLPAGEPAASVTNGIFVTTPLLFDTATEVAQNFRTDHIGEYGIAPDWTAAFSYDAARLAIDGIIADIGQSTTDDEEAQLVGVDVLRKAIRDYLTGYDHPERAKRVVGGERYFGPNGANTTSVQIGLYNGASMISALTQLQPILERGVTGFLDLVQQGKVLYVNDRFMYRTNVVYTGVQLLNVEKVLEQQGEDTVVLEDRFKIDFLIWFRYRGDFQPQDVVFLNAVEPITLSEPDKTGVDGDLKYESYRVSGTFKLEFSDIKHAYGTLLTGLGFHHRLLSRNNLMYVTDVLGMGLVKSRNDAPSAANAATDANVEEAEGWLETLGLGDVDLASIVGDGPSGDPLLDGLRERRVFAALPNWAVERSWISQEVYEGTGEGDPAFIGFGKQAPEFTRIDLGVILGPAGIDPADAVPYNWFVYLLIFGVVGLLFAAVMDRKDRGQFWRFQTLGIRAICWPILLVSLGTLVLDYSAQNLPDAVTDTLVLIFDTLWWMIPARLLVISLERFLWVPIEERSGRRIPNVVRLFASGSVYLLAVFGVVAFVFDQKLTSLLATSGLLAMIIGLAIQANIANIFSGIVLNIERPFKVGDWVMVDEMIGQVTDITWRTMRLMTRDGYHVSIPNGQVSESLIQNFSTGEMVRFSAEFFVPERYQPRFIEESIRKAEARIRARLVEVLGRDDALDDYTWRYDGVKVFELGLFHRYRVDFWIDEYFDFEIVRDTVYIEVFEQFGDDGVEQGPAPMEVDLIRKRKSVPKPVAGKAIPAGGAAE
ncbi:ABC transporter substrate-binding protein [Pacificispira sp.]|uniref:ABC transporter substrate-binding protein n=1 Tax=Pacificispira sp. TaxID=2888761 RepID=UPI003B52C0E6